MMLIKRFIAMLLTVANYSLNRERLEAVLLCRASPAKQKQCFVAADERKEAGLALGYLRLSILLWESTCPYILEDLYSVLGLCYFSLLAGSCSLLASCIVLAMDLSCDLTINSLFLSLFSSSTLCCP